VHAAAIRTAFSPSNSMAYQPGGFHGVGERITSTVHRSFRQKDRSVKVKYIGFIEKTSFFLYRKPAPVVPCSIFYGHLRAVRVAGRFEVGRSSRGSRKPVASLPGRYGAGYCDVQ
jgi:hypothetical protein